VVGNISSGKSHQLSRSQVGSPGLPEDLVALGEELAVGLEVWVGRGEDSGALEAVEEHRAVLFSEDVFGSDMIRPTADDTVDPWLPTTIWKYPGGTNRIARRHGIVI
jgi:hypothetical protein